MKLHNVLTEQFVLSLSSIVIVTFNGHLFENLPLSAVMQTTSLSQD